MNTLCDIKDTRAAGGGRGASRPHGAPVAHIYVYAPYIRDMSFTYTYMSLIYTYMSLAYTYVSLTNGGAGTRSLGGGRGASRPHGAYIRI